MVVRVIVRVLYYAVATGGMEQLDQRKVALKRGCCLPSFIP